MSTAIRLLLFLTAALFLRLFSAYAYAGFSPSALQLATSGYAIIVSFVILLCASPALFYKREGWPRVLLVTGVTLLSGLSAWHIQVGIFHFRGIAPWPSSIYGEVLGMLTVYWSVAGFGGAITAEFLEPLLGRALARPKGNYY